MLVKPLHNQGIGSQGHACPQDVQKKEIKYPSGDQGGSCMEGLAREKKQQNPGRMLAGDDQAVKHRFLVRERVFCKMLEELCNAL